MPGDVGHPERARVVDQQPEHAAAVRRFADPVLQSWVDAVRDELGELPVRSQHAQRAVTGADHLAGGRHDPLEGAAQVEVGADAHHGIEQPAQPLGSDVLEGHVPAARTAEVSTVWVARSRGVCGGPASSGSARPSRIAMYG